MLITYVWQTMKMQLWQSALPEAVDEKTCSGSLAAGAHPPSALPYQASLMSLTAHFGHLSGASSWPALSSTDAPWGTSTRGLLCSITAERQTAAAASWRLENLNYDYLC